MKHRKKTNILLLVVLIILGLNFGFGQDEKATNKVIEITFPDDWSMESTRQAEQSFSPDRKAFIKKYVTRYTDLEIAVDSVVVDYLKKEFTNIKELSSEDEEADGIISVLKTYKATAKADRKPVNLTTRLVMLNDESESPVVLYIGVVKLPDRKKLQDIVSETLKSVRIEMVEEDVNAPVSVIPKTLPGISNTTTADSPTGSAVSGKKCRNSKLTEAEVSSILKQHNEARTEVGVPSLEWDCRLAEVAQEWADQGIFEHSPQDRFSGIFPGIQIGENLYWGSRTNSPPGVKSWLDEKPFWNNTNATCQTGKACGHYTQIVWRTTTHFGCGINRNTPGNFKTFFVCNYSPAGNFPGPAY